MHRSLRALATDLQIRVYTLLESLPPNPPPAIASRAIDMRLRLQSLAHEADALLALPLEDDAAAGRHLATYGSISGELLTLEQFDAPFVIRWADADQQITDLCHRFLDAIGWPYERPLVGAFSYQYYWAAPRRALIGVPANEERRALGLGDLCHELGHLAFLTDEAKLSGSVLHHVQDWLRRHRGVESRTVRWRDPADFLNEAFLSWREWLQEFVCDAFATYLVGPAYGWQHIRLCCVTDHVVTLHEPLLGHEHPADEARWRVILATLRRLAATDEVATLSDHWAGVLAHAGTTADAAYDLVYPNLLLDAVAENVVSGCEAVGLRRFSAATEQSDIAVLAREAWRRLLDEPDTYAAWERGVFTAA